MSRTDNVVLRPEFGAARHLPLSSPEVAQFKTGGQLNRSGLSDDGQFAVFNGGIGASGRHSEFNTEGPTIIVSQGGASAGYVNYIAESFWAGAHCYVVTPGRSVDLRYLYHVLKSKQAQIQAAARGAGIPGLARGALGAITVPVPPLQVQREIARILDQFTDLQTELEAEIKARRTQRHFYLGVLLGPGPGWRRVTIGDVATVFDGPHATPQKTQEGPWYLSISSLKDGRVDLSESAHLSSQDLPKWTRRVAPQRGDTLFSYETRLGQAAYWDSDEPAALGRRMGLLRPNKSIVEPRFLTLAYLGPQFQTLIRANTVTGSTVDRIPIADLGSWQFEIPPLDEQRRIISTLDKFDALVSDTSVGLPAELVARRRQYEYYRDKLLTFEEAAA